MRRVLGNGTWGKSRGAGAPHPARWIGWAGASLAVHLLALAALGRALPARRVPAPIPVEVAFLAAPPAPAIPPQESGAPPPAPPPARAAVRPRPRHAMVLPRTSSPGAGPAGASVPEPEPAAGRPEPAAVAAGVAGGVVDGIPGGVAGGEPGGVIGGGATGGDPLAFDAASMTRPQYVSGPSPAYTRRAIERGVEGEMVVRCVIGTDGAVRRCEVLQGLPFLDRPVVEALEGRRYRPAMRGDTPVEVKYSFRLHMKMPR